MTDKIVDVRIKTAREGCWYEHQIGNVFKCYDYGKDFVLQEDYDLGHDNIWRHISKNDVTIAGVTMKFEI